MSRALRDGLDALGWHARTALVEMRASVPGPVEEGASQKSKPPGAGLLPRVVHW